MTPLNPPQDKQPDMATELDKQIDEAIAEMSKISSENKLTQIGWLVLGLDVYHRSNGKMGHSKDDAARFVISRVVRLLARQRQADGAAVLELINSTQKIGVVMDGQFALGQAEVRIELRKKVIAYYGAVGGAE